MNATFIVLDYARNLIDEASDRKVIIKTTCQYSDITQSEQPKKVWAFDLNQTDVKLRLIKSLPCKQTPNCSSNFFSKLQAEWLLFALTCKEFKMPHNRRLKDELGEMKSKAKQKNSRRREKLFWFCTEQPTKAPTAENEKLYFSPRLAGALKREWFTTMRLWNLKRAHISMIYTWFLLCILIEIFIALRAKFELALTSGERNSTWRLWMVSRRPLCKTQDMDTPSQPERKNL